MIITTGKKRQLSAAINSAIDAHCISIADNDFKTRLPASEIGHVCSRYLWYMFRWQFKKENTARQLRVMDRGTREESRFVDWFRGIGCTVYEYEPQYLHFNGADYWLTDSDSIDENWLVDGELHEESAERQGVLRTYSQWKVSACNGHMGGKLDAIGYLPETIETLTAVINLSDFDFPTDSPVIFEFKNNATGAPFNNLKSNGCELEKQLHYDQQCFYAYKKEIDFSVYANINKNDDDIYIEIVEPSKERGAQLEEKGATIICATTAPEKISKSPNFQTCATCPAKGVCHGNMEAPVNCRSCKYAKPIENTQWFCEGYQQTIPHQILINGCENWVQIR